MAVRLHTVSLGRVTKWLIITCLTAITDLLKYFKAKHLYDCLGVSSAAVVAAEIVLLSHHFLFYLLHFPVYKTFPENLALVIKTQGQPFYDFTHFHWFVYTS